MNNIMECIDNIYDTEDQSFENVMESYWECIDKACMLVESNPEIFQEAGGVFDKAKRDVKYKEAKDSNKFISIIAKIPRMIIALIKRFLDKFRKNPEGLSDNEVKNVHEKMDEIIQKAKESKKDKFMIHEKLGIAGIVTASGLIIYKKAKDAKTKNEINKNSKFVDTHKINQMDENLRTSKLHIAELKNGKVYYNLPSLKYFEDNMNKIYKHTDEFYKKHPKKEHAFNAPIKESLLSKTKEEFIDGLSEKNKKIGDAYYKGILDIGSKYHKAGFLTHWVSCMENVEEKDLKKYFKKFKELSDKYIEKMNKYHNLNMQISYDSNNKNNLSQLDAINDAAISDSYEYIYYATNHVMNVFDWINQYKRSKKEKVKTINNSENNSEED